MKTRQYLLLTVVTSLLMPLLAQAQDESGDPFRKIITYTIDQSRKDCAAVEAEVRKASPAQYAALEAKLLAALKSPDATPDCKNFVCRQLATVGSPVCIPAVAPLLLDQKNSHMARFALEPNASPTAGAALLAALTQTKGKLQVGIISSIGARRDAQAVGALAALIAGNDEAASRAAVVALGHIGTADALEALESVNAPKFATAIATAQLDAARHLAAENNTAAAIAIYKALTAPNQPKFIQIAAARGLIGTLDKNDAIALTVRTLQAEGAALRSAALSALQDPTEKDLRTAIAAQLPNLNADAQLALLPVLADQADIPLRAALLSIINNPKNQETLSLALGAMATHGEAQDVQALMPFAVKHTAGAQNAMETMSKPGVDAALIAQLDEPSPASKAAAIEILSARRSDAAMAAIVKLMANSDAAVADAAVKAVSSLGTAQQLPAILAIISDTDQPSLRTSAENAAKTICSRVTDKAASGKAVLSALNAAKSADARVALLRILSRAPSTETLAELRSAMKDAGKQVSDVATRELIDWPDIAAAPYILDLAKTTQVERDAVLALRGAIRLAALKDQPASARLAIYRSVLEIAKRDEEKKQAIAGLGDVASVASLDLAMKYLKDPALGNDAAMAAIRLSRQLANIDAEKAKAALTEVQATVSSDELKKQADAAMAVVEKGAIIDGYVTAWTVAGPYMQEGKDAAALFDIVFPPERAAATLAWRPIIAEGSPPLVGLDKAIGGNERVAYLRTIINSTKAQPAQLELGSDDGIKVFLNGRRVFANNAIRGNTPGQDKVKINLRQGANVLLLKVTQGGGEWSACCRLVSPSGGILEGISVSAPTER